MSNVAKFLIVLNLILAGVFVGSAANYLGQKDYVQTDLQKEVDALKSSVIVASSRTPRTTGRRPRSESA